MKYYNYCVGDKVEISNSNSLRTFVKDERYYGGICY